MFSSWMNDKLVVDNVAEFYNRKLMGLFCSIVIAVDVIAFFVTHMALQVTLRGQDQWFSGITSGYLAVFFIALYGYYKVDKVHSSFFSSLIFTLILSYRLLILLVLGNDALVLIVYMGIMGIISSAFYLRYELLYVSLITQSILAYYLISVDMPIFEVVGIVSFSTAIILSLVHISYKSRQNFIELDRQKAMNDMTSAMLESLLNQLDEMVLIVDQKSNFVLFNASFRCHTGFLSEPGVDELIGALGLEQFSRVNDMIERTIVEQQKFMLPNLEFLSTDDTVHYFSLTFHPFAFAGQSNVLVVATDLTMERNLSVVKDLVIELNHMLSRTHTLEEYFECVLQRLMSTIHHADLGSVLILSEDETLSIVASRGYAKDFVESFKLPIRDTFFVRINPTLDRRPVVINDIDQLDMEGFTSLLSNQKGLPVFSSISCPVFLNNELHGLINLDSSKNKVFTQTDLEVMTFLMDQMSFVVSAFYHQEQTRYLSTYDQLTGLYNRWYLDQIAQEVIPFCERHSYRFVLMVIDLNHLKRVNDERGHHFGDAYLVEAANQFRARIRHSDLKIRIGGDEFVVVFYNADLEACFTLMAEISMAIAVEMTKRGVESGLCSLAYGAACFPEDSTDLNALLRIADSAMYQHKHKVKNRYRPQ